MLAPFMIAVNYIYLNLRYFIFMVAAPKCFHLGQKLKDLLFADWELINFTKDVFGTVLIDVLQFIIA